MGMPLVSVIIPCFNNAEHIVIAIDSVLTQDYGNIEIIVVNDGSTDNSPEVLQQYDGKIHLITQKNQGPAVARNNGIKAARGDFIAFLDGDDIWLPGKIRTQVEYLQNNPQTGLCYTNWLVWDQCQPLAEVLACQPKPADTTALVADRSGWLYTKLLEVSAVCTITAMLRADIVRAVGFFNENYPIGEDHDYWIRVSRLCQIDKLCGIYAVYRQNPHSTTKKVHRQNYSLLVLQSSLAKFGPACPSGKQLSESEVNQLLGERHFSYGYHAMKHGHRSKALNAFKACIALKYRLPKALLYWLVSANRWVYQLFFRPAPDANQATTAISSKKLS